MDARLLRSRRLTLDNAFERELEGLAVPWRSDPAPGARALVLNEPLAEELGVDLDALVATISEGAEGVAMAYAGHQFGNWVPRLGDGRALLLGEAGGRDIHLKGSGRTPFARGGDGKAAIGPMLREHLVSEAMHALGIPTTRSLGVIATGEDVMRETRLPGAVLIRVAASHIRVGTFQYAAAKRDPELLRRLADHAIARHHPHAGSYLAFFESVMEAQAKLIAQWMNVGFIHGVMNTDNMAISGETIDYGPCAFMDAYDPATVFSSIDHMRRYAYGNQPPVAQWNLARLAEALLPLLDEDAETALELATASLATFPDRYNAHLEAGLRAKLGGAEPESPPVGEDFTGFYRARHPERPNPVYIPRNHLVEEALAAATGGDLAPFERLLEVLRQPFDERPGLERYAEPAEPDASYRTFCGT